MGLWVGIPPYPWGSCLERGTAAEDAGLPPINVYECVFVKSPGWWWGTLCISCGGHTEPPPPTAAAPAERGDATDAFHGCMPCARLRCYGSRSAPRILARSRARNRSSLPLYLLYRGHCDSRTSLSLLIRSFFFFFFFFRTVAAFVVSWKWRNSFISIGEEGGHPW